MPESDAATLPPPSQRPERWLGNASILIVTQLVAKVLGTVLTIVAARTLGVADYGLYMFALTFGGIFGLIAAFGLPQLITRQVARDTENTGEVLGAVLLVEAILSLAALLVMAAVLLLLDYSTQRLWIVLLAGSTMLLNAILGVITAFYRGHQRMGLEAAVRLLLSALNLGLSLAVLLAGLGIVALATVQLAVFVAVVLLAIALAARKLARPRFTVAVAPSVISSPASWLSTNSHSKHSRAEPKSFAETPPLLLRLTVVPFIVALAPSWSQIPKKPLSLRSSRPY